MSIFRLIPRTVMLLGFASFFNDLSSEMIYPMMPLFLSTMLGAGALQLGLIEGVAESTAAFLKIFSGVWADRLKRRHPFILGGYFLAGSARSWMGLATSWPVVLITRFFDRLGKGVRTSPRDALIADVTPQEHHGKAYGLHRAMDHAGAAVGPLIAAALLWAGFPLQAIFFFAAIPAGIVMITLFMIGPEAPAKRLEQNVDSKIGPWNQLSRPLKIFLVSVIIFELGGSTDAFLLLRLSAVGVPAGWVACLWSGLHVIKMTATYFAGPVADTHNRKRMLMAGWVLYAAIYLLIGMTDNMYLTSLLFLFYGLYFGLTEPTERAIISHLAPKDARGTAFGFYHGAIGLAALPAGLLFGYFWKVWGAPSAFFMAALLSAIACGVLFWGTPRELSQESVIAPAPAP